MARAAAQARPHGYELAGVTQRSIAAVFLRGGSSKGVFFHVRDLPADRTARRLMDCRIHYLPR